MPDLPAAAATALRDYVKRVCGLCLGGDKDYLLCQRLEPLAAEYRCASLAEFAARLPSLDTPRLREQVTDAITTHETSFFRDGHPFDAFRDGLAPEWCRAKAAGRASPVRVWSAGVSTGQEAYSLAVCVLEHLDAARPAGVGPDDFVVLGTDASPRVLATAAVGEYPDRETARGLGPERLRKFFQRRGANWAVGERLRRLVEFRPVNLVQPWPDLGWFDAVFCRNVLIYFDEPTRRRVCEQFHARLTPGGVLVVGAAESLFGVTPLFEPQRLAGSVVYRKAEPARA